MLHLWDAAKSVDIDGHAQRQQRKRQVIDRTSAAAIAAFGLLRHAYFDRLCRRAAGAVAGQRERGR
jgi:hypothetical protein